MDEQELISHIEDLGLSNKEARVYVAALAVGPASVQRLADQSGIKRVTVYVVLESLIGLGLISQSTKGKKTVFVPEDPSNLQRLIDKRQIELQQQKKNFESIMPQLAALGSSPRENATVRLYDSADGIKSLMRTFIKEAVGTEDHAVVGFSNLDQLYSYFPEFRQTHSNPDRLRNNIRSRFLYSSSEGPIMKQFDRETQRVSRWIPQAEFPNQGDFTVVGDHIMLLAFEGKHPVGITIASAELAQGLRVMFDLAWKAAEKYN
ncbi:MAG TPA: helix-turn-helix domain-containing protein [Candidatus Saccharimonadia bacterium]